VSVGLEHLLEMRWWCYTHILRHWDAQPIIRHRQRPSASWHRYARVGVLDCIAPTDQVITPSSTDGQVTSIVDAGVCCRDMLWSARQCSSLVALDQGTDLRTTTCPVRHRADGGAIVKEKGIGETVVVEAGEEGGCWAGAWEAGAGD
jgi:hypothetical protein